MTDYDSEYYDNNAQAGDRKALGYYYRLFKKELGSTDGRPKVLEYGCGTGHLTKRLAQDFDCYALDISDFALSQVKKLAPTAKTIKTLSKIKNGSLDAIIGLHVMEHIKVPGTVFKEFHQKLKPGGLLLYVVPNPDGFGHKLKKDKWFGFADKTHISLFGEKRWVEETQKSGFTITKIRGDGMWDVPYLPAVPNILQKLFFFPPAAVQVITATAFLPTRLGECLIVIARKQ